MSIFGKIMGAIFGTKADAAPAGGEKPRTVKVGREVDLSQLKAGDEVSARITEAMAIVVEKPQQRE